MVHLKECKINSGISTSYHGTLKISAYQCTQAALIILEVQALMLTRFKYS